MPVLRSLLTIACFCAGLVGACAAIQQRLPFPKVLGTYQKWLYFKKNKDEIDLVFVGSSRVYHSIIPGQFDQKTSELTGRKIRSFNFGYDAMWPPESLFMVRQILAMKSSRLRWIVLEGLNVYPDLNEQTLHTRRTAYWHDWKHTSLAWAAIAEQQYPSAKAWSLLEAHGSILMRNWTNQGRGAEEMAIAFGIERRKKESRWEPPDAWKNDEGYEPEKDRQLEGEERTQYERDLAARRVKYPEAPKSPVFQSAYREILREIRVAGVEPIVIITPTLRVEDHLGSQIADASVWSFHHPNEYPALFAPEHRHDTTHLNHAGAKIFSDVLAERFAEHLGGKR